MSDQGDLRRELGFWAALTIGAGTMIGAGIFLLAGPALDEAGPAAIFAYLLAGVISLMTAASAAELATGMPTSGGDYFFVSRSLGASLGAISGLGIWMSLTVAISFYLFGMGEFLAEISPVRPLVGGVVGGMLLIGVNVVGAKASGGTQIAIVAVLVAILFAFIAGAAIQIDPANLSPFFPQGGGAIVPTTALVFVSFLGFTGIAVVAEEIQRPARNLPLTIMGSVVVVTILYVLVVLALGGMLDPALLGADENPLPEVAEGMVGRPGALAIVLAGLLATASSANASVMAASRINLAMARDQMLPRWLARISERFATPYRSILLTGALSLTILVAIPALEALSQMASTLQLFSYIALNLGALVLRAANPEWYTPRFRTPGYPWIQLLAAAACFGVILFSGPTSQLAVVIVIVVSLSWYAIYGRSRADIRNALALLPTRVRRSGFKILLSSPQPAGIVEEEPEEPFPVERSPDPAPARHVVVGVAHPDREATLLRLSRYVAAGEERGGVVSGVHLRPVPITVPLREARRRFAEQREVDIGSAIEHQAERVAADPQDEPATPRALTATEVHSVTDVTYDVADGIAGEVRRQRADLVIVGWAEDDQARQLVSAILRRVPTDVGVLKERSLGHPDAVLVPWGGGPHSSLALELGGRIARASGARLDVLRVIREDLDPDEERETMDEAVRSIVGDRVELDYQLPRAGNVEDGIGSVLAQRRHDLVIIGASWRGRRGRSTSAFGRIPNTVADRSASSVLLVRRYVEQDWTMTLSDRVAQLREAFGFTSSPEDGEGASR